MSTRAHHRREQRAAAKKAHRRTSDFDPHGDDNYGTTIGWYANEADAEEARQSTHDTLITLLGDRRTGPVTWITHTGQEAVDFVDMLAEGTTGAHAANYAEVRRHLTTWGGWVVLAIAPGRP